MRDLHSADLPIATTEPITSHNEYLQVVKSSAIAKHLTERPDILYGTTAIPQGIYNKVETLPAVQDNVCNRALFGHHGKQSAKKITVQI